MTVKTHDWVRDLAHENAEAGAPWWPLVYRALWPSFQSLEIAPRGSEAQRAGIDRVVRFPDGRVLSIQEKTRRLDRPDLLIEVRHVAADGRTWPGWIEHTSADYLLCLWKPSGVVRLWGMAALRRAWMVNRARWLRTCRTFEAHNAGGYKSVNVAVPLAALPPARTVHIDPRVFAAAPRGRCASCGKPGATGFCDGACRTAWRQAPGEAPNPVGG